MNFRFTKSDGTTIEPLIFAYQDRLTTFINPGQDISDRYDGSGGRYSLTDDSQPFPMTVGPTGAILATDGKEFRHDMFDENTIGMIAVSPSEIDESITWEDVTVGDLITVVVEDNQPVVFKIYSIETLQDTVTPLEVSYIGMYHISGDGVFVSSGTTPLTFTITRADPVPYTPPQYYKPLYTFLYSDLRTPAIAPGANISELYSGEFGRYSFSNVSGVQIGFNGSGQIISTDSENKSYTAVRVNSSTKSILAASPSDRSPIEDINWDLVEVGDRILFDGSVLFDVTGIQYLAEEVTPVEIAVVDVEWIEGDSGTLNPGEGQNRAFTISRLTTP